MWPFHAPPRARVKAKYGFDATPAFLDKLQLSSVRFSNGGSGVLVSSSGLTVTNHHVGRDCVQANSSASHDYIRNGFYASTLPEEAKCPGLELDVLIRTEDVTARMQAAVKPGMSEADAEQAQRATQAELESTCAKQTQLRCDLEPFYSGATFFLYQYKVYSDVRLVFAPEASIAFFGGDPDNFEYPRYDLDLCLLRVYENNAPAHTSHFLPFAVGGVAEGDLVFVPGHPGRTERLLTTAELDFLREVRTPNVLAYLQGRSEMLRAFSGVSQENARLASSEVYGVENSLKAARGRNLGLQNTDLMAARAQSEKHLRQAVAADPRLQAAYGGAWVAVEKAVAVRRELFPAYFWLARGSSGFGGDLLAKAQAIVRAAAERQKPEEQRLGDFTEARLPTLEAQLLADTPVSRQFEEALLVDWLTQAQSHLGNSHPMLQKILQGRTPAAFAKDAIAATKMDDVAVRKQLLHGGPDAIAASTDPLIIAARNIEPDVRDLYVQMEERADSVIRQNSTAIAKARFAVLGTDTYPDATFTLRLSYGVVKGYSVDGKKIPAMTTLGGAFTHGAEHGNKDPFELPKTWFDAKPKLNLNTPFNFVSTADIIGGNSGSPTVNRKGEVVGIIFDGNIQSLPWDFAYEDKVGRAVSVDSRAILEAMRKIYHAGALADELEGKQATAAGASPR